MRFALALFLTFAALTYSKAEWVPLLCVTKIKIKDFGICTEKSDVLHCPNSDIEVTIGCVKATKPEGAQIRDLPIDHPSAVEVQR